MLLSLKKMGLLPFATTWMSLEGITLSKIIQAQRGKYVCLTCGEEIRYMNGTVLRHVEGEDVGHRCSSTKEPCATST
jgi:DNA-directed RNA polymerase subunit RPC12/RpoP